MKFMVSYSIPPASMVAARARFLETGGNPPAGVKMLGRWHGAGQGFALAQSDDPKAVYEWAAVWADLMNISVIPVVEDADAAEVLGRIHGTA